MLKASAQLTKGWHAAILHTFYARYAILATAPKYAQTEMYHGRGSKGQSLQMPEAIEVWERTPQPLGDFLYLFWNKLNIYLNAIKSYFALF